MVDVRLPDGRVARFPDTMPREEIKAFISFKFPDQAPKANPNDTLMALARTQMINDQGPAPVIEGNEFASSLPGPLGQFQNSTSALQSGFIEGATGNLSNEIVSALGTPIETAVRAVQGKGFDPGQAYNNLYEYGTQQAQGQTALNPSLANRGNLMGSAVLGKSLGALTPRASTPLGMAGLGALEGAGYGAVYGFGGAEGNERYLAALRDAGVGALTGGAVGLGAGALTQPVSQESRIVARALEGDRIDPATVGQRVSALGPAGMVADIGPNLQNQTAAIATLPGQGSVDIVDALSARRAGANERIRSDVTSSLGPSERVSQVLSDLDIERKLVNQDYEPVFRAKALSDNPFMDATPIVSAIDDVVPKVVGGTRSDIERIKGWLIDPRTGAPTKDPQVIMAVRQELDGLINAENNTTTAAVLGDLRKVIDQDLAANVPGLKAVDADFQEIAQQKDALERGGMLLNDGKTAINPADLSDDLVKMSDGQRLRLTQGTRAEIDRIIGTSANDRVKLRDLIRGEGSWNYEKLRSLFGDDKARALLNIVDREATMAATENLATAGSRTQVLKAAQDDIVGQTTRRGPIQDIGNFQWGSAASKVADALLGGVSNSRREAVRNAVAQALISPALNPRMVTEITRLLSGASKNESSVIAALLASQAAAQPN